MRIVSQLSAGSVNAGAEELITEQPQEANGMGKPTMWSGDLPDSWPSDVMWIHITDTYIDGGEVVADLHVITRRDMKRTLKRAGQGKWLT